MEDDLYYIDHLFQLASSGHPTTLHNVLLHYEDLRQAISENPADIYPIIQNFESNSNDIQDHGLGVLKANLDDVKQSLEDDKVVDCITEYIELIDETPKEVLRGYYIGRLEDSYIQEYVSWVTADSMKSVSMRIAAEALVRSMASEQDLLKEVLNGNFDNIRSRECVSTEIKNSSNMNKRIPQDRIEDRLESILSSHTQRTALAKVAEELDEYDEIRQVISDDECPWHDLKQTEQRLSRMLLSPANIKSRIPNEKIEQMYLSMKVSADNEGDNLAASRLFMQEKRSRLRKYFETIRRNPFSVEGILAIRNFVGNSFLWLTAGYGERPGQVIISSFGVLGVFVLAYIPFWGVDRMVDIFILSLSSFVSLVHPGHPSVNNPWLMLITQFEGFIGAFMIGLFVFSLTRSVHR
jgi:hypothetical protein